MLKQLSYPKSQHCPRGRGELRSYLDDLEFATKFFKEFAEPGVKEPSNEKVHKRAAHPLSLAKYAEPDLQVRHYLEKHDNLIPVLKRSVTHLTTHFGSQVACEFDLLEEGSQPKLFVKILTKLSAEAALEQLDQFDQKWWFKEPVEARRRLEFVLEFQ